jgi:hypothetical protein
MLGSSTTTKVEQPSGLRVMDDHKIVLALKSPSVPPVVLLPGLLHLLGER